jgi:hypothetical protein
MYVYFSAVFISSRTIRAVVVGTFSAKTMAIPDLG